MFSKFRTTPEISDEVKGAFSQIEKDGLADRLPKSAEAWKNYANHLKGADDNLKKFLQSEKYGKKDLANFTKFLKEQNKGLTGFKSGLKEVGKSLKSFGINLGLDLAASAITSLVSMGIDKLMSMEHDAAEKAQESYDSSAEQVEKIKEKEELVFSSTKKLTDLLETENWSAEQAKKASEVYSEMAI